jgi:arsenite-transporting ATPase
VIVNRIFPDEVGDYFARWRGVQAEHLELVRSAFAPVPVLRAPYFDQEVVGPAMLDRLAEALFGPDRLDPAGVLHDAVTQELEVSDGEARLRVALPFTTKAEVKLKKIGLELVVAVDGQKRTIMLPDALAGFRPTTATLQEGALEVTFNGG